MVKSGIMKHTKTHIVLLLSFLVLGSVAFGQKSWSLVKNSDWIKIYQSDMDRSNYKRVKVECTLDGTFDKLLQVLNNVANHKNWIYNTRNAYIIKRINPNEYYYYTETALPWPMQNRDAVVRIRFERDNLNRYLKIVAVGEPDYLSYVNGKVRVPRSANTWYVTSPEPGKLHIVYVFEADPGGSVPSWLVNTFINKGPYESFKNLAEELRR